MQCYSLAVIGYRLMIFNDCESAAEELREVSNAWQKIVKFGKINDGLKVRLQCKHTVDQSSIIVIVLCISR